jgi:hypothetical protein
LQKLEWAATLCDMVGSPQQRVREWAGIIFKTEELAQRYLTRPNAVFQGKVPMELARSHKGADWVIEELTDAAFGAPVLPAKLGGRAPAPPKSYDRASDL